MNDSTATATRLDLGGFRLAFSTEVSCLTRWVEIERLISLATSTIETKLAPISPAILVTCGLRCRS
jgi:hypothetical protein